VIVMQISRKVKITNSSGLHARPAAIFVQIANKFVSDISITKGDQTINGKSIMGILMLAAEKGTEVELKAEGDDAEKAIDELSEILIKDIENPPSKDRQEQ